MVTEVVRKELKSDSYLPESRIAGLIDAADTAMEPGDYSRMEDIMDELAELLQEN